jgi:hypothetical protein
LQAFDQCGLADFSLGYLQVLRGDCVTSSLPYFVTRYRIDTMVTHPLLKRLLRFLDHCLGHRLGFRIACAGHPSIDVGQIDGETSPEVLHLVNQHLATKARLVVYKMFTQPLPLVGFAKASGFPVHILDLPYFAQSMRASKRKNFRKRLAVSAALRFEFIPSGRDLPTDLIDRIASLYAQTEARASHEFAPLPSSYFAKTAAVSQYQLAFEGDRLIGFIQVVSQGTSQGTPQATPHSFNSAAKYIGMDSRCGQRYGLYFSLILTLIEALQPRGCQSLDLGITSGYFKRLLGAKPISTHIYYRHSSKWLHSLLARCQFLLEPSPVELG